MKLDFNFNIKDLSGNDVLEQGKAIPMKNIFSNALISPAVKIGDVLKKWSLAQRIDKDGLVDIDEADLSLIKQIANEKDVFVPAVQAQLLLYLDSIK